ncbi:MAG: hypothetical protein U5R48_18850 [Gammaproteobacteria bacterium]|nr:hypothetical protein [Gammaproteobacteria bacterium]
MQVNAGLGRRIAEPFDEQVRVEVPGRRAGLKEQQRDAHCRSAIERCEDDLADEGLDPEEQGKRR